jgi:hypothetical protein
MCPDIPLIVTHKAKAKFENGLLMSTVSKAKRVRLKAVMIKAR